MADLPSHAAHLEHCLARLRAGDEAARDELLGQALERLQRLARKMLRGFPRVRRWEETDDVLQNAVVRLLRALREAPPASTREFFALTTTQIRRELLDLARHYYGPRGPGAKHASNVGIELADGPAFERPDQSLEPSALAEWCEFHEHVNELPVEEKEVVGLLFYQELPQAEAAEVLGVSVRTVQRRWHSALLKLHQVWKGQAPGS
jgi:RNA polymerase sigma-70 factor (ECF subfamily)